MLTFPPLLTTQKIDNLRVNKHEKCHNSGQIKLEGFAPVVHPALEPRLIGVRR